MITAVPMTKGAFKTDYSNALRNSEFAEDLINLMVGPAGNNYDRPTLSQVATLGSIESIGQYYFGGLFLFVTADRNIHTVASDGTVTNVTGIVLPGADRATFANDGTTVFIAGGGAPLKWAIGGTTALLGGSPPDMTHIVYMDGYLMGNRRLASENYKVIQYCDYQATETWPGGNIFSHVADPDPIQGLTVSQRELYAVGAKTTEVWQNVGSYPVPFARSFVWQYGSTAPYSILSVDNSVCLLDQERRFLRLAGRSPMRLSEGIEKDISAYSTADDCFGSSFSWKGATHVLWVFPTAEKAWSINLGNGQWTEWRGYSTDWARVRIGSVFFSEELGLIFAGDYQTGAVWQFSDTVKTDAGGIFKRVRTFSHRDGGASVRKRADLVRIGINRTVATVYEGDTDQTNPQIELRWKDDGKDWSDYRRVSLGERGTLAKFAEFRRLGIYRSRQYQIQMSDPAECNVSSFETDEQVMTS